MLPPALVRESSIATNLRNCTSREGSPERASRLLERASATTLKRWVASVVVAPCSDSANNWLTVAATSTAEAYCSGITIGSLPLGWSIESMMRASRCMLLA